LYNPLGKFLSHPLELGQLRNRRGVDIDLLPILGKGHRRYGHQEQRGKKQNEYLLTCFHITTSSGPVTGCEKSNHTDFRVLHSTCYFKKNQETSIHAIVPARLQ
jgi:hypothetical protein